jgi:putative effector of murein hydrolase
MSAVLTLYCIGITVGAYALSRAVAKRHVSPLTTPVFFSTALIMLILLASGLHFDDYRPAKDLLVILLGPATVALAVPIFKNRRVLVRHAAPALIGIVVGAVSTISVAIGLGLAFEVGREVLASVSVKSVTAPIAIELVGIVQGNLSLAAAMVIATGMIGAMFGQWLMDRTGIVDPLARGLALGAVSHGQGTAQALTEGELQGAIAGIAMGLTAILTSIVLPPLLYWVV